MKKVAGCRIASRKNVRNGNAGVRPTGEQKNLLECTKVAIGIPPARPESLTG